MTAPASGRTADENELRTGIIAALNAAFRGFSFPGGRWSTGYGAEMAADALIAGPLAPVLAEIAQLRSRLLEAEQGAEAMRARTTRLEEALRTFAAQTEAEWMGEDYVLPGERPGWTRRPTKLALIAIRALNPNQEAGDHEPR